MYRGHEGSSRNARKWLALFLVFVILFSDAAPAVIAEAASIVVTKNESEQAEVLTVASTDAAVSEPVEITEKAPVETISTAAKSKASVETISTGAKPKAKTTSIFSESKKIGPLPTVSEVKVEDPSASSTEEGSLEPREDIDAEKTEETETGAEETESLDYTTLETNNAPVRVSITFSADAEIPEGVELVVTDPALESNPVPLRNTLKAAQPLSAKSNSRMSESAAETPAEYPLADVSLTEWKAGESGPEIELYHRQLEISLIGEDGSEIEPNPEANVTVSVTLPDLEEGLTVEVYHETDDGNILLNSRTDGQTVTFTTNSFSLFDFTSTAQKLSSWTSDLLENTFFGKTASQGTSYAEINVQNDTEGLTILEAFTVSRSTDLWMTLQRIRDLVLGNLESIVLYTVEDGHLGSIVKENITLSDVLRFSLGDLNSFALVRDSGLRRKTEKLGNIILNGMMPKNATSEATDVTEAYEDFKPYEETIAAYDITISNNGEEFQPDGDLITVMLQDEQITEVLKQGKTLKLWHIIDENTKEEITDFTAENDTIIFEASGFSAYVLTYSIEKVIALDGETYKVTVSYGEDAEIPEDADLEIHPVDAADYQADAMAALNWTNADYIFYTKFLDISIVKDGEEVKPKAPVSVSIQLLDVTDGAEALQVVHFGAEGAEEIDSQAAADGTVTFTTNSFSVFGFGNALQSLTTAETETANIEILGFNGEAELTETDAPEVEEGLEVLGAYTLGEDNNASLWIKAELKNDTELSDMESVIVCAVNEEETKTIIDPLTTEGQVIRLENTDIALVKDSGYRHLNLVLNMDEQPNSGEDDQESTEEKEQASNNEDARIITLNGMMPKEAEATAVDVTEAYAEFSAPEAKTDEQETANEKEQEEVGEKEQIEADREETDVEEESEEKPEEDQPDRMTLAAYDISILNNETEYQPDTERPINVEIVDSRITDKNIELWHISGTTVEQVTDFTVEAGRISFTAQAFSVYVITHKIETYFKDAEGATYKITVEYGDEADIPDEAELVVSEVDSTDYLDVAKIALNWTETDYIFYTKYLDISIVKDGAEIKPQAPVHVTVTLLDVEAGKENLQVVHFGEEGAEELNAESSEEAVVKFETESFSVFGIGNALHEVQEAENDLANVKILSFDAHVITEIQKGTPEEPQSQEENSEAQNESRNNTDQNDTQIGGGQNTNYYGLEEGLELVQTIPLNNTSSLWLKASLKKDAALTEMESVTVYSIENDVASKEPIIEELTGTDQLYEIENTAEIAIVKDTGYRRLNFVVNLDHSGEESANEAETDGEKTEESEENGSEVSSAGRIVILNGMMPKKAKVTVEDVTITQAETDGMELSEDNYPAKEDADESEYSEVEEQTTEEAGQAEAEADPEELTEETPETEEKDTTEGTTEEKSKKLIAAYDITILNGEEEYQPGEDRPIMVEILDSRITADKNIQLWHIKDDGTKEQIIDFGLEEGRIVFVATGFSAYAIVSFNPGTISDVGWLRINSLAELDEKAEDGFYISSLGWTGSSADLTSNSYYFWKNNIIPNCSSSGTSRRSGIEKIKPSYSNPSDANAELFYFEKVSNNQYYIFFYQDGVKQYLRNPDSKPKEIFATTVENERTIFTVGTNQPQNSQTQFTFYGNNYINMTADHNGRGFAAYDKNNDGSKFYLWYFSSMASEVDPYGLNNHQYGLMNWNGGVAGKAMMAEALDTGSLKAKVLEVLTHSDNLTDKLFVPNDSDISMWTFHWIADDKYFLTTKLNGVVKYLRITTDGLEIVDEENASRIQVIPGTGEHTGQIFLMADGKALTYSGQVDNGFNTKGITGSEWLYLVDYSDLTADYMITYSASKVSVSDDKIGNGSKIIVYTRFWNDNKKKYEFYAINDDGSLVQCFESGDSIQWIGNRINTLLWNLVEYYDDQGQRTNYYELYNEYSEKYIAPQISSNQILSSDIIGINLDGRKKGYYYSTISAWDDAEYSFASLMVDNGQIGLCEISDAYDFFFAVMQDLDYDDDMITVQTVDHEAHGITMKIKDFGSGGTMNTALGNSHAWTGTSEDLQQGILSTNLDDNGYPIAVNGQGSLANMFSGAKKVNHLFIASTYNGTGYYTYDSTQNYAYLQSDNTFRVYKELGTHDTSLKPTLQHGQFFPFNDIEPGVFASVNKENLYPAAGSEQLSDSDPRKHEKLYLIKKPNYYFGVELEASFIQTPSGKDNWGHDIIYEFTGDDDFWLYVDGELIIDLGGIHSALAGNVNYSTGEVVVSGTRTTLKDLFYKNYKGRGHTDAEAQTYVDERFEQNEDGQWIFKDYTTHTMRIFYLERGAGASNLNMRFNLASVQSGHIELSKKLEGVDNTESMLAEFPFQIWYKPTENDPEKLLNLKDPIIGTDGGTGGEDGEEQQFKIRVFYKDTKTPVTFKEHYTIGGVTYNNVFMLKPGEMADIDVPDDGIWYKVIECGINTDVYESVKAEGNIPVSEIYGTEYPDNRRDYEIPYIETSKRPRVAYVNTVNQDALRTLIIKKKLYDETGENEINDDSASFSFRLSFSTEADTGFILADKYTYHIIDKDGYYCRWDSSTGTFVSTGVSDYSLFTTELEKKAVSFRTSMNGAISKIPAAYTVEIREVLVGTQFGVEERSYEIPDGYSLQKYELYSVQTDNSGIQTSTTIPLNDPKAPVTGIIEDERDSLVHIRNLKGYGLRIYKTWTDDDYMAERGPTFFAVYINDGAGNLTLASDVKRMQQGEKTLYWYFETLGSIPFERYEVREVVIEAGTPTVDVDDIVTNKELLTITPVPEGGTLSISGRQKGEETASLQDYKVHYDKGTPEEDSNVRVDYVTNTRPGVVLKKTNWDGTDNLDATKFSLQDASYDPDVPAAASLLHTSYTSDADGYVTTAFLCQNTEYILTETKAKTGYHGLQTPVTFTTDGNGRIDPATIVGMSSEQYTLTTDDDDNQVLTIKNKLYTFAVRKQDSVTDDVLAGAHFSLHRERTVGGVTLVDFTPMTGYEDLVSDSGGIIPGLNQTLPAGTYELRETQAPPGYEALPLGIKFKLSDLGAITLLNAPAGTVLDTNEIDEGGEKRVIYTLKISNSSDEKWPWLKISKQVEGGLYDITKKYSFLITLNGTAEGQEFNYSGSSSGKVTFNNEQTTVDLAHGEYIVIERLPLNSAITITETGNYDTAWKVDGVIRHATNNTIMITLADNAEVEVTNTLPYVAPTAYKANHTPYILLLVIGIVLLMLGVIDITRKKKRMPETKSVEAKVQSHEQWVEIPPRTRGAPPSAPPCPRADLWAKPTGSTGKRGDPGL